MFKQHSQLTLQQRVSSSLKLMRSGREGMTQPHHTPTSLPYLESVAMLRYSLSVVAELLTQLTVGRQQQYTHDALLLMEEAKQCCFIPQLNEYEAGPAVYLVKLLIRQYGQSFLSRVCDHTELLWVVPEHLRQTDEVLHIHYCVITVQSHMYTHRIVRGWTGLSSMILAILNFALHYWTLLMVSK